jgi:hypothetical protein
MATLVQEKEMVTTAHMKTLMMIIMMAIMAGKEQRGRQFFERKQRGRGVHAPRPRTMARRGRRGSTLVTRRKRTCGNRLGYTWPAVFR